MECEKTENKQKEAGIGPFFKKKYASVLWSLYNKINKTRNGRRSAARFKPEVNPISWAQKCPPEVN